LRPWFWVFAGEARGRSLREQVPVPDELPVLLTATPARMGLVKRSFPWGLPGSARGRVDLRERTEWIGGPTSGRMVGIDNESDQVP
jgi:hypothetical protein